MDDADFRSLVQVKLAEHVDQIVLFPQRRGVRVIVVSTTCSEPPLIASELRRQAGSRPA